MELTGKCKEAFYKWLHNSDHAKHVYCSYQESGNAPNYEFKYEDVELPEIFQNALIKDFFDSVGIYIQDWGLNVVDNNIGFDAEVMYNFKNHSAQNDFSKKRQDAIINAIKKSNEIYNQNY